MESCQWVIGVSTAIIAIVLLTAVVFLIKVGLTWKKNMYFLTEDVERRIEALDNSWRDVWNLTAGDSKESSHASSRIFPWILRSVVFATAFWNNFQKRR